MSSEGSLSSGEPQPMRVLNMQMDGATGEEEYLVQWVGGHEKDATWVPASRMQNMEPLINAYKEGRAVEVVDCLLAKKLTSDSVLYLVKWAGNLVPTWEAERQLVNAREKVLAFNEKAAVEVDGVKIASEDGGNSLWMHVRWQNPKPTVATEGVEDSFSSWTTEVNLPTAGKLLERWGQKHPAEFAMHKDYLEALIKKSYDEKATGRTFLEPVEPSHEGEMPDVDGGHSLARGFSEGEVEALKKAVAQYGQDWARVGEVLDRNAYDCRQYWFKNRSLLMSETNPIEAKLIGIESKTRVELAALAKEVGVSSQGKKGDIEDRIRAAVYQEHPFAKDEIEIMCRTLQDGDGDWHRVQSELAKSGFERGLLESENALIQLATQSYSAEVRKLRSLYARVSKSPVAVATRTGARDSALKKSASRPVAYSPDATNGKPVARTRARSPSLSESSESDRPSPPAPMGSLSPSSSGRKPRASANSGNFAAAISSLSADGTPGKLQLRYGTLFHPSHLPNEVPLRISGRKFDDFDLLTYKVHWKTNVRWCNIAALATKYGQNIVSQIEDFDLKAEADFEISAIIGEKKQGTLRMLHVQWKDYPDIFNRWEVESNIGEFSDLLVKGYRKRIEQTGSGKLPNPTCVDATVKKYVEAGFPVEGNGSEFRKKRGPKRKPRVDPDEDADNGNSNTNINDEEGNEEEDEDEDDVDGVKSATGYDEDDYEEEVVPKKGSSSKRGRKKTSTPTLSGRKGSKKKKKKKKTTRALNDEDDFEVEGAGYGKDDEEEDDEEEEEGEEHVDDEEEEEPNTYKASSTKKKKKRKTEKATTPKDSSFGGEAEQDDDEQAVCDNCERVFSTIRGMRIHFRSCLRNSPASIQKKTQQQQKKNKKTSSSKKRELSPDVVEEDDEEEEEEEALVEDEVASRSPSPKRQKRKKKDKTPQKKVEKAAVDTPQDPERYLREARDMMDWNLFVVMLEAVVDKATAAAMEPKWRKKAEALRNLIDKDDLPFPTLMAMIKPFRNKITVKAGTRKFGDAAMYGILICRIVLALCVCDLSDDEEATLQGFVKKLSEVVTSSPVSQHKALSMALSKHVREMNRLLKK